MVRDPDCASLFTKTSEKMFKTLEVLLNEWGSPAPARQQRNCSLRPYCTSPWSLCVNKYKVMLLIFYTSVLFCAVEPHHYLRTYRVSQCPVWGNTWILSIASRRSSLSLLHPAISASNTKHPLLCQLGGRFSVTHREEDLKWHTGMCRMLLSCRLALNTSTLCFTGLMVGWTADLCKRIPGCLVCSDWQTDGNNMWLVNWRDPWWAYSLDK